ncbi:hypothetical protein QJS82_05090 [Psychrobacter maritimus]|uniref:hypothetical protein n=1 Tax=Psychrobacter maritimus TaxID=256325 RepID=UPI00248C609D|nr:hypothetical protein [Psychrobacter sp. WB2]WGV14047.1 hypothetical protein QJS82_05090 [Psychrobacter sp. WB2]
MRYTHSINAVKCQEWQISLAQGALVDLINQASSWANADVVDGEVYYWVSRNKVINEIPVAYSKADTVYRSLKVLASKGIINHIKQGKRDLVNFTEKGKTWNVKGTAIGDSKLINNSELDRKSEINPTSLGNKSEKTPQNSEINSTYKNTSINKSTSNKNIKTAVKSSTKHNSKSANEQFSAHNYLIPYFINDELWFAYNDMRVTKKKPATKYACKLLIKKLTSWHEKGLDVSAAIEKSIVNGWTDVFEPAVNQMRTTKQGNNYGRKQSPANYFDSVQAEIDAKYGQQSNQQSIRTVC